MKKGKYKNLKFCEYCHPKNDKEFAKGWTILKQSAELEELVTIRFCPMCGRKLDA